MHASALAGNLTSAVYMRKYASRKETTNILHEARIQSKERSSNRGGS